MWWPQWEKAWFCNGKLKNSTIPPEPLLSTAQVSQRDDVTTAKPHLNPRWEYFDCLKFKLHKKKRNQTKSSSLSSLIPIKTLKCVCFFLLSLDRITCLRLIDCFLISPGDGIGRKNRSYLFLNGERNEYCEQKILFQGLAVLILKKSF